MIKLRKHCASEHSRVAMAWLLGGKPSLDAGLRQAVWGVVTGRERKKHLLSCTQQVRAVQLLGSRRTVRLLI